MSEIACYSLDIPTDEFFLGSSIIPDKRKMLLPTQQKGFLGVNIDYEYGIGHFLYDTPEHRNRAYSKIKDRFKLCAVNINTCYVDEKYLKNKHPKGCF